VQRIWNVGLIALAVAVFCAAAYVIVHNDDPARAHANRSRGPIRSSPPSTSAGTPSSRPPSSGVASASAIGSTSSANDRLVVAFLGDDWTAGAGASSTGKRFSTVVSRQLDLAERNFGGEGSGYAKSGPNAGTYRRRIAAVVAADPDVVVVSGGRNDRADSASTAAEAARKLFATLHDELPDAMLIAVAPFWGDSDLPAELAALSTAVKQAVTKAGGSFVDVDDPIHGHPEYMADDADPNNRGYAAIAAAVTPLIGALLPAA